MLVDIQDIERFVLILIRVTAALAVMPIFGQQGLPNVLKIGLGFLIAHLLSGVVSLSVPAPSGATIEIFLLAVKETVCGLLIGYATQAVFYAVDFGGAILGYQTGFSIVASIDPMTQNQNAVLQRIQYISAMLIFLTIDGHHLFLSGLARSFETIPLGGIHLDSSLLAWTVGIAAGISEAAIMLAAPIMVALLLTDIGLGVLARVAPQMNIFVVGFPLKVAIVLLLLSSGMTAFGRLFLGHFAEFRQSFFALLKLLAPA
ncbi:MAG: flagellar biosynthetic protein FliR [bacterium]